MHKFDGTWNPALSAAVRIVVGDDERITYGCLQKNTPHAGDRIEAIRALMRGCDGVTLHAIAKEAVSMMAEVAKREDWDRQFGAAGLPQMMDEIVKAGKIAPTHRVYVTGTDRVVCEGSHEKCLDHLRGLDDESFVRRDLISVETGRAVSFVL